MALCSLVARMGKRLFRPLQSCGLAGGLPVALPIAGSCTTFGRRSRSWRPANILKVRTPCSRVPEVGAPAVRESDPVSIQELRAELRRIVQGNPT